ncbi:MAG: cytidylate kinase [Planctomyces sp.]|nr:cytidylate kinase [Planctomyces sp.]
MVGRELAKRLDLHYLDTGVMYRAITWLALKNATPIEDEAALSTLADETPIMLDGSNSDRVLVDGISVGPELREAEVDHHVSLVSRVSSVRSALVAQQRRMASEGKIVMVGRDIGTVVLPNADMKIYITASPEERARRRWKEFQAQGRETDYQSVLNETKARDDVDTQRDDSPLKPAEDAWVLDTDGLTGNEVVDLIVQRVTESFPGGKVCA